jgi:hypothetical protein
MGRFLPKKSLRNVDVADLLASTVRTLFATRTGKLRHHRRPAQLDNGR